MKKRPRVAFIDLENAPNLGFTWEKYEQDVIAFVKHWYLLSFSVKWQGEKKTQTFGLIDFPIFKKDKANDLQLVQKLHEIVSEAEVLIAHNGDRHDIRKMNARMIFHGLTPPDPFKTIDTLKIARNIASFPSNKLDDLGAYFGVGRKLVHTGFDLWLRCMNGEPKAWEQMKRYNAQDVVLLEKVYNILAPWAKTHTPLNIYGRPETCPRCGRGPKEWGSRGTDPTLQGMREKFQCKCGKWIRGKIVKKHEGVLMR